MGSSSISASSTSSATVLVAGSALLAAAGLGYLATTRRARFLRNALVPSVNDNEITAAEVCEIYARLLTALQMTYLDLECQIAPYRPHLPSRELKAALATELERALRRHRQQILSEKDIDMECFDDAVRDLMDHNHSQVKQAVTKFQIFWENCANELFPVSSVVV